MQNKSLRYTLEQIAKHNSEHSCWLLIDKKVYDVTEFKAHPGGFDELLQNSGRDATQAFKDIGHPRRVLDQLEDFFIGDLEPQVIQSNQCKISGIQYVQIGLPIAALLIVGFIGFKVWKKSQL